LRFFFFLLYTKTVAPIEDTHCSTDANNWSKQSALRDAPMLSADFPPFVLEKQFSKLRSQDPSAREIARTFLRNECSDCNCACRHCMFTTSQNQNQNLMFINVR
jgi:hypothetical protein